jgi:hypothetical protein
MKLKEILRAKEPLRLSYKEEKISEEEIKHLLRYEIFDNDCKLDTYDDLCFSLIVMTKCNVSHAQKVFKMMCELGFDLCLSKIWHGKYDLLKFAILRNYITVEEMAVIRKKDWERVEEMKKSKKNDGDDSKFYKEVLEDYRRSMGQ